MNRQLSGVFRNSKQAKFSKVSLHLENLEDRAVPTANLAPELTAALECTEVGETGLYAIPVPENAGAKDGPVNLATNQLHPLTDIPVLNSLPNASASLYLDFNGHFEAVWGSFRNISTPVYDTDGNLTTYSDSEISDMVDIWQRIAEDYAIFNINVTTVEPSSFANGSALRIAMGGSYADWYGNPAGGVGYVDSFTDNIVNTVYVFAAIMGNPKNVAEAGSHEAGHGFGLQHQSLYDGTSKVQEYNPGGDGWAPIMGVGYYQPLTTFHNGANSFGSTSFQDDIAVVGRSENGFGFRDDDYGSTFLTATPLANNGSPLQLDGLIGSTSDFDIFSFQSGPGHVSIDIHTPGSSANLDSVLEFYNADGNLIDSSNSTTSLDSSLSLDIQSGLYYIVVKSNGIYGRVGTYSMDATVPAPLPPGPRVVSLSPTGTVENILDQIQLVFDQDVDQNSFSPAQDIISFTDPFGNDLKSKITLTQWVDSKTLQIFFVGQDRSGVYSLTLGPNITAPNGSPMDQDGDGISGEVNADRYTANINLHGNAYDLDAFEANDLIEQASDLGAFESRSVPALSIHRESNLDFFKFTTVGAGTLNVKINFQNSVGDLSLALYDSNQTLISTSNGTGDSESITVNSLPNETYYVLVQGTNDATNLYSMQIVGPDEISTADEIVGTGSDETFEVRLGVLHPSTILVYRGGVFIGTYRPASGHMTIRGMGGADNISANPDIDLPVAFFGGDGNDTLTGGKGSDTIQGENGNDFLFGRDGDDTIDGGAGSDNVDGMVGNDLIIGGDGDDFLFGSAGTDSIVGGIGNDGINGGDDNDTVQGEAGNDYIEGGNGSDSLLGGDGLDGFDAGAGNDFVDGGTGNDFVYGFGGNDTILGQDGNDGIDAGDGNDLVNAGVGDDFVYGLGGNDTLLGNDGNDGIDGGLGDDSLVGGNGDDLLFGAGGNDIILGQAGNDSIDGNAGNDSIDGGDNNDLIFASGGGSDTVRGGAGDDVLQNVDSNAVIYGDAGNDMIFGADFINDSLLGNDGNDTIIGLSGNDTIISGAGFDVVDGGEGTDLAMDPAVQDKIFNAP